ncbi:MAG: HAD family hydrolase [Clostridia bacterium]|nr:HAD family hydrolase [Clostridia bacterium]
MGETRCILFDCMETLVDLTELPTLREYALWTFEGSGSEHYWGSFDEFFEHYQFARDTLAAKLPEHKEYEIMERFELIAQIKLGKGNKSKIKEVSERLYDNYWKVYESKCYVKEDVKVSLSQLARNYKLGVVSNFMVKNGIEILLKQNGIFQNFDFVVTSVNEGWRKPHPHIYNTAVSKAGYPSNQILFVGDDYVCDYIGPGKVGLRSILLDRYHKYPEVAEKIKSFNDLLVQAEF